MCVCVHMCLYMCVCDFAYINIKSVCVCIYV